jgi:hypothetical protein
MLFPFTIEPDRIVGIEAVCSKCKRNNKEKDVLVHSEGLNVRNRNYKNNNKLKL